MRSRGNSFARADSLYEKPVTPHRTREMRGLLNQSAAETAAMHATAVMCEYLNRWNDAGPAQQQHAEEAINIALGHNPELFLAHYAKGFLHRSRGEHQAALEAFDETIRLAPEFARVYAQKGEQYVYLGEPEKGIAEVEQAIKISPRSSVRGYFYWVIGRARFFMQQDAEAVPRLQASVRAWPNVWYNRLYLVAAHAFLDKRVPARRVLNAFHKQFPGHSLARVLEHEEATPNEHPFVVAGRDRFHEGLRRAGLL